MYNFTDALIESLNDNENSLEAYINKELNITESLDEGIIDNIKNKLKEITNKVVDNYCKNYIANDSSNKEIKDFMHKPEREQVSQLEQLIKNTNVNTSLNKILNAASQAKNVDDAMNAVASDKELGTIASDIFNYYGHDIRNIMQQLNIKDADKCNIALTPVSALYDKVFDIVKYCSDKSRNRESRKKFLADLRILNNKDNIFANVAEKTIEELNLTR